ncbi:hypothetical protein [Yersinia enterocolitica]|uniref:hypothetical protein n=1 Tax=Yersinia enterocolitica TaxID=630 RepID=UPI001CA53275|nr:hypothetical protein [Yersinia enterocolitica]MBW5870360.1 hypothetical protein [Yersinia enterocolitica]
MNSKDKELLDHLKKLKEEKPDQKVLLVFPGKPQIEISTDYQELHRTFTDLLECQLKHQKGEDLKDVAIRSDDGYGHFCRSDNKGSIGVILEPTYGVMLRFPIEVAFDLYRQILSNDKLLIETGNVPESLPDTESD